MIRLFLLALFLSSAAVAQEPKCPDTHYPCGDGAACCSR